MSSVVGFASGGGIRFQWVPDPEVVATEILKLSRDLQDVSSPLAISRGIAQRDTREHFENQETPDGQAWAPWAPSYEPIALATNQGRILQRTYATQDAATSAAAYPATDDALFFDGSVLESYAWMNYYGSGSMKGISGFFDVIDIRKPFQDPETGKTIKGTSGVGKGGALPARPMVGISKEAQEKIVAAFEAWFAGTINTAFVRGGRTVGAKRGAGGRFVKQS